MRGLCCVLIGILVAAAMPFVPLCLVYVEVGAAAARVKHEDNRTTLKLCGRVFFGFIGTGRGFFWGPTRFFESAEQDHFDLAIHAAKLILGPTSKRLQRRWV